MERIAQVCAKKQEHAAGLRGWLTAANRQIEAHMPKRELPQRELPKRILREKP